MLDNFNDNTKTDWTDFTFVPGLGIPSETGGQFVFEMPPAGQSLFSCSTKTSETFTLQEGRTIEFRVDIAKGGGGRSYAILGFIPQATGPQQLMGYSMAKSTTDVLLVKGVQKYFVDDDQTAPPKQDNTTLVLRLTVKSGNVIIHGEVLDKDQNDKVIWERTVIDTPEEDVMQTGKDDPKAPFLGAGNFTLFLYQDFNAGDIENPYRAVFDNAEVFVTDSMVLDDFNDNIKTDWEDFTFVPGLGVPQEKNGQFVFEMPPAGQAIFSASTKKSPVVELKEGEQLQFQVDIVEGNAKDSFAVMGFIPTSSGGPGTLKGYSLAKSTTDVLIVKGINKYFVASAGAEADLKQNNVTLVMTFTVRNGNVTIDAQVLDKDDNNKEIWHRRVVDTPEADVLDDGTDDPKAPFIGTGNFVLFLYEDFSAAAPEDPYRAIFDNAIIARVPQTGNVAPIIGNVLPVDRSNFVPAPAQISFKVTDDQPMPDTGVWVTLNGIDITKTNGLTVTGGGTTTLTATLGNLGANTNYIVTLHAKDAGGLETTSALDFDTFATNSLVIELENYNYGSGQFIDKPVLVPESSMDANSYSLQLATSLVDYNDTRTTPAGTTYNPFRPDDNVRTQHSLDNVRAQYAAAGGGTQGFYDYDIIDIAAGEWLNYTHTFPAGSYQVYLREALANMATGESVFEKVTSDRTQENQTTEVLGSFLGTLTGFTYKNFPLTDASGQNKVVLRLDGVTTLRLRQVTPDSSGGAARGLNYLVFIPVADVGKQRATVSAVSPAAGSTVQTVAPKIAATIQNRDTTVNVSTVKLELNGQPVTGAQVTATSTGADIAYTIDPLPAAGATNQARITFKDNENIDITSAWQFVVDYKSLDPALRVAGAGKDRGFNVRVVQEEQFVNTENSLTWAESLLAPNTTLVKIVDTNVVAQVINFSQNGPGSSDGTFPDDAAIPGIDVAVGTDDIAMEATAYLDLPAGKYRFGTQSDDGYKVQVVANFADRGTAALAFHNGGPADETYDFYVSQGGLYRFRLVWYERGGGAHVEWFQGNFSNTDRVLLNSGATGVVKAYATYEPAILPPPQFTEAKIVNGQLKLTWSNGGTLQESADMKTWSNVPSAASPYSTPVNTTIPGKYYRVQQ